MGIGRGQREGGRVGIGRGQREGGRGDREGEWG